MATAIKMDLAWVKGLAMLCLLAGACLAIAACDTGGAISDTGPNANLSNDALIHKAVADMKSLQSYHFEFAGGIPTEQLEMSSNLTITADIQLNDKGSRVRMSDNSDASAQVSNPHSTLLYAGSSTDMLLTKEGSFESYDGGKTWYAWHTDTSAGFLMGIFGLLWGTPDTSESSNEPTPTSTQVSMLGSSVPSAGEQMLSGLSFKDGSPRIEKIDGATTRHMIAEAQTGQSEIGQDITQSYLTGAETISLWVSTDVTPTIRQMQIKGSNSVPKNKVGGVKSITFSSDGATIASAHEDGTIRLWDATAKASTPKKLMGDWGEPLSVAFSPDGKTLAAGIYSGGPPSEVRLWGMDNLDSKPITLPTQSTVAQVVFRPDGKQLAAAGGDGVYIWNLPYKGEKATFLPYPTDNVVNSVAYSPDGSKLATGNLKGGVRIHDLANLQASPTVLPHEWVNSVAFHPNGYLLASIGGFGNGEGQTVKLWDLHKPNPTPTTLPGDSTSGQTVAFSPDGKLLVASGQGGEVLIWSLSGGEEGSTQSQTPVKLEGQGAVYSVAFSPDGKRLAAGNSDGGITIWDVQDPKAMQGSAPTILREDEQVTDTPYALTWKWGRFNEDFGKVEPPPPDKIKQSP